MLFLMKSFIYYYKSKTIIKKQNKSENTQTSYKPYIKKKLLLKFGLKQV